MSIRWKCADDKSMKTTIKLLGTAILGGGLFIGGCAKRQMTSFQSLKDPEVVAQLKSFVAEKEAQAKAATNEMPSEFGSYFAAAAKGDWWAVSNKFVKFRKHAGQYDHSGKTDERLRGTAWQAVLEIWGALDAVGEGDEKYALAFATNIVASIPPGSIYFGGTDPGRFVVTALCKSQVKAVLSSSSRRTPWPTAPTWTICARCTGRKFISPRRRIPENVSRITWKMCSAGCRAASSDRGKK